MKRLLRRLLVLLSIILLTTTTSFSLTTLTPISNDSIVYLTREQLKETNLIFAEHHKLLVENKLLEEQISNYKKNNELLMQSNSIKEAQINLYKNWNGSLNESLEKRNKSLLIWKVGGITVSASLLLVLLFK